MTLRRMYHQMLKLSDIATFSGEEAECIFRTNEPVKAAEKALKIRSGNRWDKTRFRRRPFKGKRRHRSISTSL